MGFSPDTAAVPDIGKDAVENKKFLV